MRQWGIETGARTISGVIPASNDRLVTIRAIAQAIRADGSVRFACLTCYDATTARLLQHAGVPLLLVGDTAAEVILGLPRTIHMPIDVLIALTAGVKRGAPNCIVMGDLPFMSYQISDEDGMRSAGRFMTDGLADIVKLEADESHAGLVDKLTRAGVPICAHVGSKPQQAALTGGYTSAGKTASDAMQIVRDAVALEQAGAAMLLIEAVPDEIAEEIVKRARVPVIGIGAGTATHGQVLVIQDLLGLSQAPPRFAVPSADLKPALEAAFKDWTRRVTTGDLGGTRTRMAPAEAATFKQWASQFRDLPKPTYKLP